ncbi:MAG TPA: SUMF1/EgtB/PvdO family nonheme iron enzyme, partial [Ktedonobacterales bacterium]
YKQYQYIQSDGREDSKSTDNRTLRGGSWVNVPFSVRAAYRGLDSPVGVNFNIGFRVVLAAPGS